MAFQSPTTNRQALKKQDEDLAHIGSWANIDENARNEAAINPEDLTPSHNGIRSHPHHANSNHVFGSANELSKQPSPQGNTVNSYRSINGLNSSYLTTTTLSSCQDGPSQLELWTQGFWRHEEIVYRLARS
ncbi:hypothetical protein G7Y89_g15169 [Cudoniella acicularis]|uniref:Uncharacterized protein n=1 Tax=Cudoniella acicularis TaxID=354080 RepID=A0A8H4QS80_9HELO|nr:hypothetical protein G7Y89_g15169 [Cudoniella acicularis]